MRGQQEEGRKRRMIIGNEIESSDTIIVWITVMLLCAGVVLYATIILARTNAYTSTGIFM